MNIENQENITENEAENEIPEWENTGAGYEEAHEGHEPAPVLEKNTDTDESELLDEQDTDTHKNKLFETLKDIFWVVVFILMILVSILSDLE